MTRAALASASPLRVLKQMREQAQVHSPQQAPVREQAYVPQQVQVRELSRASQQVRVPQQVRARENPARERERGRTTRQSPTVPPPAQPCWGDERAPLYEW